MLLLNKFMTKTNRYKVVEIVKQAINETNVSWFNKGFNKNGVTLQELTSPIETLPYGDYDTVKVSTVTVALNYDIPSVSMDKAVVLYDYICKNKKTLKLIPSQSPVFAGVGVNENYTTIIEFKVVE